MKKAIRLLLIGVIVFFMSSCGTNKEFVDRYTVISPDKSLMKKFVVGQPPLTSPSYSILSCDQKETIWTLYTTDLLYTIGLYEANTDGLLKADAEAIERVDKLNKELENKK